MKQSERPQGVHMGTRNALTKQMALEAAGMEAQLASLRSAMAKEKLKREQASCAARSGSSIWTNGASAALSKGGQVLHHPATRGIRRSSDGSRNATPSKATPPASSSGATSATQPVPPKVPAPTPSTSRSPVRILSRSGPRSARGVAPQADNSGAGLQPGTGLKAMGVLGAGTTGTVQPCSSTAAVTGADSPSDVCSRQLNTSSAAANSHAALSGTGTSSSQDTFSCGMDDSHSVREHSSRCGSGGDMSLLHGEYDEAASRSSFLDALNDWRKAGLSVVSNNQTSLLSPAAGEAAPGKQRAVSSMDVQTNSKGPDGRPGGDDSSDCLKRLSSSSSGTAVSSVGGCYLLKLLARSGCGSSSSKMHTCLPEGAVVHMARSQQDNQQHDQQQGAGAADIAGKGCDSNMQHRGQPSNHASALIKQLGRPAAHDDEEEVRETDAPDGDEAGPCFDDWLVAAEQHAEQAVACSGIAHGVDAGNGSSCVSSTTNEPNDRQQHQMEPVDSSVGCNCQLYPILPVHVMEKAITGHDQRLSSVLLRLEALEVKQSSATGAGLVPDEPRRAAVVQQGPGEAVRGIVHFTSGMRLPDAVLVPEG